MGNSENTFHQDTGRAGFEDITVSTCFDASIQVITTVGTEIDDSYCWELCFDLGNGFNTTNAEKAEFYSDNVYCCGV